MKQEQPQKRVPWHSLETGQVLGKLATNPEKGLDREQAAARLKAHGLNVLEEKGLRSPLVIFLSQFSNFLVLVLVAAAAVSALIGNVKDAVVIGSILVLNAVMGFVQEYRAQRAMDALKQMSIPLANVLRDGMVSRIDSTGIVAGDLVLVEAGNRIPADGRLISAQRLQIRESALTGESVPVNKQVAAVSEDSPLADRQCMVYMGSEVTGGTGVMVVTETGMGSELGRIAGMIRDIDREDTPLQKRLEKLGRTLSVAALGLIGVISAVYLVKAPLINMDVLKNIFMTAVSLAVAAVPEGLPAVVTIALALGAKRMLARNALVRRLYAVETLGSTTVICSDKTGTLTQNMMTVTDLYLPGDGQVKTEEAVRITSAPAAMEGKSFFHVLFAGSSLCCEAVRLDDGKLAGDPTETALIDAAERAGFNRDEIEKCMPRVGSIAFDSMRMRMSTLHRVDPAVVPGTDAATRFSRWAGDVSRGKLLVFTKGSVGRLLDCTAHVLVRGEVIPMNLEMRHEIAMTNEKMAEINNAYDQVSKERGF